MEITRNKHFKAYLEKLYIRMAQRHLSITEEAARIKFNDEYMEDIDMINFVINSTYPNTKPVDDHYEFITKDEFFHTRIDTGQEYPCGRMTLRITDQLHEHISFDNPKFVHGQVMEDGRIACWGGFTNRGLGLMFINTGLSGMLMDLYNFARVSNHDTYMKNEVHA